VAGRNTSLAQCGLQRRDTVASGDGTVQGHEVGVQCPGGPLLAALVSVVHRSRQFGNGVRQREDTAVGTGLQGVGVDTTGADERGERVRRRTRGPPDALDVAAGILDPDDGVVLGDAGGGLRLKRDAGELGHAVAEHRQRTLLGQVAVVDGQVGGGVSVVVRRDREDGVRAGRGGLARSAERSAEAGTVDASDHGEVTRFDDRLDHPSVFSVGQVHRLARRTTRHEEVDVRRNVLHDAAQSIAVEVARLVERRDQWHAGACDLHAPSVGGTGTM